MMLYQEVTTCPTCRTRLTVTARREPASDRVTEYEIKSPVCGTSVPFAIRGVIHPGEASLICFERPLRA
jgi:uncharacterized protein YbaR (Trm112 family)